MSYRDPAPVKQRPIQRVVVKKRPLPMFLLVSLGSVAGAIWTYGTAHFECARPEEKAPVQCSGRTGGLRSSEALPFQLAPDSITTRQVKGYKRSTTTLLVTKGGTLSGPAIDWYFANRVIEQTEMLRWDTRLLEWHADASSTEGPMLSLGIGFIMLVIAFLGTRPKTILIDPNLRRISEDGKRWWPLDHSDIVVTMIPKTSDMLLALDVKGQSIELATGHPDSIDAAAEALRRAKKAV